MPTGYPDFDYPVAPPSTPASLLAAIEAYWAGAGLDSAVAPLRSGREPPGTRCPKAICEVRDGSPVLFTSHSKIDDVRVRFRLQATSVAACRAMAVTVFNAFEFAAFAWTGGIGIPARNTRWDKRSIPTLQAGNERVFEDVVEFCVRVKGPR